MVGLSAQRREVQDPEPAVPRLEALASRVLSGDIVLPKFQRGFVWSRQQTLDLLDSVSRNYPIGSVLLWQSTERLASERTVAGLNVEPQRHGYPVNYILDGQQRLASICGALYWRPDGDPESSWPPRGSGRHRVARRASYVLGGELRVSNGRGMRDRLAVRADERRQDGLRAIPRHRAAADPAGRFRAAGGSRP
ncbi:DUF262 domain-containing protein [Streptomyces sp. B1866]|uniref:DUF262 domain-containing protein n=1 Tax=Streptomyces sp. B1866 TaxID=3075431 RepID=UPI0028928EA0|nr:DUF262 domain-containing protein [Streptomyces sp. B1866]MDT3395736.1 DUF262 domain-containing protein [Streptomyces sp. B1866]